MAHLGTGISSAKEIASFQAVASRKGGLTKPLMIMALAAT